MARVSPGTATALTTEDIQIGAVEIKDGNSDVRADVLDLTNNDALAVAIVDTTGAQTVNLGGTQYTEGDTDTTITGTAAMMEVAANVIQPIQGTVADGLLVNLGTNNDIGINAGTNNIGDVDIVSGTVTTVSTVTNLSQQGGVAISLNTGVRDTGTQRVTIATNDVVPVSQSGTWDEVGINDSGNNISVDWGGTVPPIGAGLESTALRVTVATDSTGVLSVDDNGGLLTVDGTITANAGTNLNTSALLTSSDFAAAFGTAGTADTQVISVQGIASMTPVQVSQATASNLNMTEASASGILTSAQLIDDTVYIDDADWTDDTSKHINVGGVYQAAPHTVTTGDVAPISLNINGAVRTTTAGGVLAIPNVDSYTQVAINLAAAADQVLVSSAANKQIWVYGFAFTVNVAGTISFQDEDNTAITGVMQIAATGGMAVAPSGNFAMPIWKLGTDKDLEVDVVTSELDGWISYAIVSV